ncbi:rod shape-determining protein [Candidatus Microgenomates bacterium]|nr:rod shape-determining protein [Candidatus Microgenomates bacterium]
MFDFLFSLLSHDLGIDLGTANTNVFVKGKGIVIRQPSVVARHKKTKKILAIGSEAKRMEGKTPKEIEAIRPLKNGVIADFDLAEAMISHYIKKIHESRGLIPKIPRPKVVIGIPSGVTEVERRAVQEAALSAGARSAFLIEEPIAAAIGVDIDIEAPKGSLVVDIGGGTSEIALISLGGVVVNRCLRVAGDEMDEAIVNFARLKYGLLIGLPTAEEVKIQIGSAYKLKKENQTVVRGRDLETGLPRSLKIDSKEIREALSAIVRQILGGIEEVVEEAPPELVADILKSGIVLAGGGSQLRGLDKLVAEETKMPVWLSEDPTACVVRGCGKLLEDDRLLKKVRLVRGLR